MAFSPDGKTLYFTMSDVEKSQDGLFKMPVLGGLAEKLLIDVRGFFALSPDGKQIAFTRTNKEKTASAMVISNLDGTEERELATRPMDLFFSSRVSWSPDGSMIAVSAVSDGFTESREVFIVRVVDGQLEQLTALDWVTITNQVWLSDGQGLMVVARNNGETVSQLWQIDVPGGKATRLSLDTDAYGTALSISADRNSLMAVQVRHESNVWIAPPEDLGAARQVTFSSINGVYGWNGFDWTPDDRIVFTAGVGRTLAIYSVKLDGTDTRQVTSSGFYDQRPSASADGRFIVFQSNRSGSNEIWRVENDGVDLRQLTNGGGNSNPHITPDGKSVIYISTREGKSFVWQVSIEGGEPARITDKETRYARVSPDGKFIACAYKTDVNAITQLAIVKIENGSLLELFDVPATWNINNGIRWMPDGKAVCYRDESNGIWRQDLNGGKPKRLENLPEEEIIAFAWSRDGKQFAFIRGRAISDGVLINDVK
jgi:Tol biopolymer transport system component